jgi:diguanylate cyclase (GGDEF)-like protein
MAIPRIRNRLAALRTRLAFLRGNLHWVALWLVMGLVLGGAGWFLLLSSLEAERTQTEATALREAAALARSYADQLARTVELVDQILLHVKYEWGLAHGQLSLENIQAQGLFPSASVFNVSIVDRNGKLVTSGVPGKKGLAMDDRRAFAVHKNATNDTLYVEPPVISRLSGSEVLLFSRRLAAGNRRFDGIALVSVAPQYFTASYDSVTLGTKGLLAMVGSDHAIRSARIGSASQYAGAAALLAVPPFNGVSGSALLDGRRLFADGRSRYVGWDRLTGYPLVAMAGLDQQDTLAPYRERRDVLIRNAVWASVGLAAFTAIAIGFALRLAWRKHQLAVIQATYRMATEGGNEGFYIARPIRDANGAVVDFEIVDCNQRGAQFLRQRREELLSKRISALYEGARPARLLQMLREAMEAGFYENDIEVSGDSPLAVRWVHLRVVSADDNLAVTLRDVSDAKAHVEELVRRSNEDVLTGLPNRHWVQTYLPEALAHAAANNATLALLFIDLDGFKKVNDTAGHAAGDEILRNAARRLKVAVRPHDYVARLGGDEFVVILEQLEHKTDATQVAERVLHTFRESFRVAQSVHALGASIGISLFPHDGTDADTLLRNADVAMYSAKAGGKGTYHFYDQRFYDALRSRLQQETELRHAIEHDQFVMHYQPRVELATGVTSSMESLVRWAHPVKGLLPPLEFIPLAEETGLIIGLGELIIDKVCAQLAYWSQSSQHLVPISINVSARQFLEGDIARLLAAALARHRVDPTLVEIEVTESSMMGEGSEIAATLTALRRMGVKLLVDDFGTGYSSLSQLQRLDFDVLKVDRAFTVEIDRTEKGLVFVKAIITMAHALGLRVVAEGVEFAAQVRILKNLHCDEIQGFYISKPLPPGATQPAFPRWIFPSKA